MHLIIKTLLIILGTIFSIIFLNQIQVDVYDKTQIISLDSKLQLYIIIFLLLNILFHMMNKMKYLQEILNGFIIGLFFMAKKYPLSTALFPYGFQFNHGDVYRILEFTYVKNTYPPLYPYGLKIFSIASGKSVTEIYLVYFYFFILITYILIYLMLRLSFGGLTSLIMFTFLVVRWNDLESPYKFFSLVGSFISLIMILVVAYNNETKNRKLKIVFFNAILTISFLSYPAYFLWSFPTSILIYVWALILFKRDKKFFNIQIALSIISFLLILPYLINANVGNQLNNILTLNFRTGDNYMYEATYRSSSIELPYIAIVTVMIVLFYLRIKINLWISILALFFLVINVYFYRIFKASQMSGSGLVELWPRLDRPVVVLLEIIIIIISCFIFEKLFTEKLSKSSLSSIIFCKEYLILILVTVIVCFYLSRLFSINFISWFPDKNNSTEISYEATRTVE